MSLISLIILLLKLSIVLGVFAIGLKATFQDALFLFRRPAELGRVVLVMNVLMPMFALVVALTFNLHPAVKVALVVLAVSPIPPILPNKALRAGGKEDYIIGLLVAISVLSVLFIPLTLKVLQWITGLQLNMSAASVFIVIFTTILAPLLGGMLVRRFLPSFAEHSARPIGLVARIVLLVSGLPILFTSVRAILTLIGDGTLLALAAFALVGIAAGHFLGGPESEKRRVLALDTASRHPAVAMGIAHTNFPNQKLTAPVILVYLVLSAVLTVPYLNWSKRRQTTATTPGKEVKV
ncbi:MAG: Na+-dependent transporter [Blastocatellia bacterium]|nr:MAG: Na+-dependent transporter [Blastocatellia bacterium]